MQNCWSCTLRKWTSAEQESQHTQACTWTCTLKRTLSPYGRVALVKWHLPNVALKHKSSSQQLLCFNWVWCRLTAAASDTISASFTHTHKHPEEKRIGERLLFYSTGYIIELSVKAHDEFNFVSEISQNRKTMNQLCTLYTVSRKSIWTGRFSAWIGYEMSWSSSSTSIDNHTIYKQF